MRYLCIACDVLARPVYLSASLSPHIVDISLERFGWHIHPKQLRQILQAHIDSLEVDSPYDALLLAYGLCGKATEGLRAGSIPLVIPRAHDCITLFLGGRDRYNQEFLSCPGTYWYVQDFVERGETEEIPLSIGAYTSAAADASYSEFVEKYGADNANYLMEVMSAWQAHYERAVYIDLGLSAQNSAFARAQSDAKNHGWRFEQVTGDMVLIQSLLSGEWDEQNFLVLQPGQQIEMVGGDEVIGLRANK